MSKLRYKREFTDGLSQEDFDEEVSEMAGLETKESKLPYRILIDYGGKSRNRENNSPRIMVNLDNHYKELVPISIDRDNPKILINKDIPNFQILKQWIIMNYDILIRHWNHKIDDFDALELLILNSERID